MNYLPFLFVGLALVALFTRDTIRTITAACAVGVVAIDYYLEPWSLFEAGLRVDNLHLAFLPCLGASLAVVLVAVKVIAPLVSDTPIGDDIRLELDWGLLLWATFQQVLLCLYLLPRFVEILGPNWGVAAASAVFGAMHLPNPFMLPLTLSAGSFLGLAWSVAPNVLVAGFFHSLGTQVIKSLIDERTLGWWKVGIGYLDRQRIEGWPWKARRQ